MKLRILSIDVGVRNLGWAIMQPGVTPSSGTYTAPPTARNIGWLLVDVRAWMTPILRNDAITHVVFEAPILNSDNDFLIIRKISAVGGLIELICQDFELPCEEELPGKVRKHFLAPHAVPRHTKEIKEAVIARCRQLGWRTETNHEADALALGDYALAMKTSILARKIGELL